MGYWVWRVKRWAVGPLLGKPPTRLWCRLGKKLFRGADMALITGKGLTAFAQGMYDGYTTGKKRELEQKKIAMELEKVERQQQMEKERAAVGELKATQAFALVTPDGVETVYTDANEANEAAQALSGLGEGEQVAVQPRFLVAGQRFNSQEEADRVAKLESSEGAMIRRKAQIALKHGFADVAQADWQSYKSMTDMVRQEKYDMVARAQASGDLDAVARMYSEQTGQQVELEQGEDGTVTPIYTRGDQKVRGDSMPLKEFWTQAKSLVMDSAATYNETRNYDMQVDKFKHQQGQDAITNQFKGASLGLQAAGQKLAADNQAITNALKMNPAPTSQMGYDAKGQGVPLTRTNTFNPQTGQWESKVTPGAALENVYIQDPTRRPVDPLAGFNFNGGGASQGKPTVWGGASNADGLVNINNSRAIPNQGATTPTVIYPAVPGASGLVDYSKRYEGSQ